MTICAIGISLGPCEPAETDPHLTLSSRKNRGPTPSTLLAVGRPRHLEMPFLSFEKHLSWPNTVVPISFSILLRVRRQEEKRGLNLRSGRSSAALPIIMGPCMLLRWDSSARTTVTNTSAPCVASVVRRAIADSLIPRYLSQRT